MKPILLDVALGPMDRLDLNTIATSDVLITVGCIVGLIVVVTIAYFLIKKHKKK